MKVAIIMGSASDYPTMKEAETLLKKYDIDVKSEVVSAHRTPEHMVSFAKAAKDKGFDLIIAGAGGAAHLPGMVASLTVLPVIGVPIKSSTLNGIDSLLSIVQMPAGVPVGTMSIGVAGAKNAALYALRILALQSEELTKKLKQDQQDTSKAVLEAGLGVTND